jgi:hypothetical protein
MLHRICTVALLTCAVGYGQLDSNTVTVAASRTLTIQPDQVFFYVAVNSGIGTTLNTVLAALQPVGITATNFSSVSTGTFSTGVIQMASVQWSFTLAAPFADMQTTVAALTSLQQSVMQNNSGLTLSFSLGGTQVSQQLQQMQVCPLSGLLSDAQAQAQKLANVAGFSVGTVVAMSSSTSIPSGATLVCSMTVEFSLTH